MTREEAIDVLKHNYPSACFTDLCEAVEIAIQALSAQPETPCYLGSPKDKKTWGKIFQMPKYKVTEWAFPKKKKRGSIRRKRRGESDE